MPIDQLHVTEGAPARAGALRGRYAAFLVAAILATAALILAARADRSHAGQAAAASAAVSPPSAASGFAAAMQAAESGSPAERRIAAARAALEKDPTRASLWNDLALGLARRARETADTAFYREAWAATERSLQIEPGNLEGRKLQVWILLGQHEFQRAVDTAEQINRSMPDDVLVYGFLVDGYTELGRYAEAEKAAQWMLDMRPGNVPGLTRAAYLRELFGDHEGAVELMDSAYRRTAPAEVEDRAWILTQIAHLSLLTCRTGPAEALLTEALKLFPDYHYALAQMAELRTTQGRLQEAAVLRARHVGVAPHPENRYELGAALARAGKSADAEVEWQAFEPAARAEMSGWDNANVELIYYYVDHAGRPPSRTSLDSYQDRSAMWNQTRVSERLGIRYPIIQGPFGGGLSTIQLTAVVSNAGGMGSFGAHHLSPIQIKETVDAIRRHTTKPFAMNLWIPLPGEPELRLNASEFAANLSRLKPWYDALGLPEPEFRETFHQRFVDQIDALLEARPPVFSFVFGIPSREILSALRQRAIKTIGAATTVDEACALEEAGVDLIVASGSDAKGHRPSFLESAERSLTGTLALVPQVADAVRTPIIAAGGIGDARGIIAAFVLGAEAAQLGTVFLATHESGASEAHKAALVSKSARSTALTRVFSGRMARGIRNRFIEEMISHETDLPPYPIQNWFTQSIRRAAAQTGRADYLSLWAGQAAALSQRRPAAEAFAALVEGTEQSLRAAVFAGS